MAKQQPTKSKPTQPGGILGFLNSIKEFFQGLIEKIKVAMEFNERKENGKKDWENSIEGKAQKKAQEKDQQFGYRTMEEHQQDQIHFPGFYKMQMHESGLLRIPEKTELLWEPKTPEDDARRYLTCMNDRFDERPNPIQTHNSQAFAEIEKDMRTAMYREDTALHQFVLGNTHIVARVNDGKVDISISDGVTSKQITGKDINDVTNTIMSAYADIAGNNQNIIYIDSKNKPQAVCIPGENGYETYMAQAVTGWQGAGENRSRYTMPNIIEVSGAVRVNLPIANQMIERQGKDVQKDDLHSVVKRAYKQADRSGADSSLFVVGDKIVWASKHDDTMTLNITAHKCPYSIAPVTIQVDEKMLKNDGKPDFPKMLKEVKKEMETVDNRVQDAYLRDVATKAYEQAKQPDANLLAFAVEDKIIWASKHNDSVVLNIAPHECPYTITPVTIPVTEKMFTDEGKEELSSAVEDIKKGMKTVDDRVQVAKTLEEQAKQAEVIQQNSGGEEYDPWTASTRFTINQGKLNRTIAQLASQLESQCTYKDSIAVHLTAGEHKIVVTGHHFDRHEDYPGATASIAMDGTILFNKGNYERVVGECKSLDEALKVVQDTIGDSSVTVEDYGTFDFSELCVSKYIQGETADGNPIVYNAFEQDIALE